jgi:hypothetical protein
MNQRPKILDVDQRILACIVGIIIGLFLYKSFLEAETETIISYKEKITIDTVYSHSVDTVYLTKKEIKQTVIRDTVLIKPIEPKIKAFEAVYPLQYGNATVSGEVLGEVLKMGLTTDFNIPVVTNTIEKEKVTTIVKKASGLYASAFVSNEFIPSVGGHYLRDRLIISYKYTPLTKMHEAGFGMRIF